MQRGLAEHGNAMQQTKAFTVGNKENYRWAECNCEARIFSAHQEFTKCISWDPPWADHLLAATCPENWKDHRKRFPGEIFPVFKQLLCTGCTVPAYGRWPPYSLPQLLIVDVSPRSVRAGQVWGGLSQRYLTASEKQQFRNILEYRLHQDTLFLPFNCTLSRNCSQPHTYTTSCGCLHTHILYRNVYINT